MEAPAGHRVRHATPRDRDLLAELFRAFVEEQSDWGGMFGVEPGPHDEYASFVARWLDAAKRGGELALLAETASGSPVGFLFASVATRDAFFHERHRGRIDDVWVRPGHRRSGIGRALADAALAWIRAQGPGRVILQVARRNEAGQAFWRSLGFGAFMDVMERDL